MGMPSLNQETSFPNRKSTELVWYGQSGASADLRRGSGSGSIRSQPLSMAL
jgi:hypothetical protein